MSDSLTRNSHYMIGRCKGLLQDIAKNHPDTWMRVEAQRLLADIDALYDPKPQGTQLALAPEAV